MEPFFSKMQHFQFTKLKILKKTWQLLATEVQILLSVSLNAWKILLNFISTDPHFATKIRHAVTDPSFMTKWASKLSFKIGDSRQHLLKRKLSTLFTPAQISSKIDPWGHHGGQHGHNSGLDFTHSCPQDTRTCQACNPQVVTSSKKSTGFPIY